MQYSAKDIIEFWFSEIDKSLWFNSTPQFDLLLKNKFHDIYISALNNELPAWKDSPEGCLALVIILDQFPLNMFRGKPESFVGEEKSRDIAQHALANNYDESLSGPQKAFLYMPFMHSESLPDQDLSVTLFEKADLQENLRFAKHHREIVKRFGRFPHRNKILDRESTEAEVDYLNSGKAFLG